MQIRKCFSKGLLQLKTFLICLQQRPPQLIFYWAMRNNDGTATGFQQYLLNIVDHYQVKNEEQSPLH